MPGKLLFLLFLLLCHKGGSYLKLIEEVNNLPFFVVLCHNMTQYFTSDFHFQHEDVAQSRGFNNRKEHDQTIIENIKQTILPGDTLWIMGDITYYDNPHYYQVHENLQDFLKRQFQNTITTRFIIGNHEYFHPIRPNSTKHLTDFLKDSTYDYVSLFDEISLHINGEDTPVMISHFCYSGDDPFRYNKFKQYRLRDYGLPIIHGETHSREKLSFSDDGTVQVCIGPGAWNMNLVSEDEIIDIIENNS